MAAGRQRREFLRVLRNEKAELSDRLLAAEMGGNLVAINDELAEALLSIVGRRDQPEELRARAAISLGPALEQADLDEFEDLESVPISEGMFHKIVNTLRMLYADTSIPKEVRRRILEGSVRAPQGWHRQAIRAAWSSGDEDWTLTAVFAMRWVRGFDREILEALISSNPDIHYEAVCAAGSSELDAAWPHVAALITSEDTDKDLLLAAIEAAPSIRPAETGALLADLADSADEDIAEAAQEAIEMARGQLEFEQGEDDEFEDEDGFDDEDDGEGNVYRQ